MPDCVDVPIRVDAKYDILEQVVKKVEAANPTKYYVTASSQLNVKLLDSVATLNTRVNNELNALIVKIPSLSSSVASQKNPKFKIPNASSVMEYTQPEKCELFLSPKIFRIFGIVAPSPWITTTKLTGVNKPGLDKFLQTMWIYTDIIQAQYVGDVQTPLLRVVPVPSKK